MKAVIVIALARIGIAVMVIPSFFVWLDHRVRERLWGAPAPKLTNRTNDGAHPFSL